jgi:FkbM family methyltransferase
MNLDKLIARTYNALTFTFLHYLSYVKVGAKTILKGDGIINKLRLFIWVILALMRKVSAYYLPFLGASIESIRNQLARKIIIFQNGSRFYCVDSASILILSDEYENWMWAYLNLKKSGVFVDIGAHIGKYTIPIARIVGENGLVVAVEPYPENYKTLVKNIKLNNLKNVIALNIAAYSEECRLKLFIGPSQDLHSIKKDYGRGYIIVQAKALDDILSYLKIERVDYIKIDVEGGELEVLKGSLKTLKKAPTLVVEIWKDLTEVKEFMSKQGYSMEQISSGDYLFKPIALQRVDKG